MERTRGGGRSARRRKVVPRRVRARARGRRQSPALCGAGARDPRARRCGVGRGGIRGSRSAAERGLGGAGPGEAGRARGGR